MAEFYIQHDLFRLHRCAGFMIPSCKCMSVHSATLGGSAFLGHCCDSKAIFHGCRKVKNWDLNRFRCNNLHDFHVVSEIIMLFAPNSKVKNQ